MGGRHLAWTDKKLKEAIERILGEHGKVTPGLLSGNIRGAYDAIYRRVRKGEFSSVEEAIEKIKRIKAKREAKYPTKESVEEALKTRTAAGKENYPSAIYTEDTSLYVAALKFKVELSKKGRKNPKPVVVEARETKEVEKARNVRKVRESICKHPGEDVIERLMREHDAYLSPMVVSLENQGIKSRESELSKWIGENLRLRKLAAEIRKTRAGKKAETRQRKPRPILSRPRTETPRLEKPAKEQTEYVPVETKKEVFNLPLSEEELEILKIPGESVKEISERFPLGGGRVESLIASILLKKNATTLEEVRKKLGIILGSQEEVIKE